MFDNPDAESIMATLPGGPLGPTDRAVLLSQLGHLRYEPIRVIARDASGNPQVVLSFFGCGPGRRSLSTNLFWVTGPELTKSVDRLESVGWGVRLKRLVLDDAALREAFIEDQLQYHRLTVRLYRALLDLEPPRAAPFGVGGVRSLDQVKCLHAHLAYHLTTGRSWVGGEVLRLVAGSKGD